MSTSAKYRAAALLLGGCLCVHASLAQSENLSQFFERTVTANQAKPVDKQVSDEVERRTSAASSDEIMAALPVIIPALQSDDDATTRYAGIALIVIGLRPNSAVLLSPFASELAKLFNSPKDYLRRASLLMLTTLKPTVPPEVVGVLLDFLKRSDADQKMQAATLAELVSQKPYNEIIINAAVEFLGRPLESDNTVIVLKGIQHSLVKDARIERLVIGELSNPSPRVQRAAIAVLDRMGPQAISQAQPGLKVLANSTDKDVAQAARAALARTAMQSEQR